jgi:excisionase family DNA binding protein
MTPEEAAQYLRVNPQTIYRLLRRGRLPGAKIGHQWRIRRSDLDGFLRGLGAEALAEEDKRS